MAQEIIWLSQAIEDLKAVAEYIALDSPTYAAAVVESIVASTDVLAEFPNLGREVPEWGDESIREKIVYSYRVIYEVRPSVCLILAVIHGARLLPNDVRSRED